MSLHPNKFSAIYKYSAVAMLLFIGGLIYIASCAPRPAFKPGKFARKQCLQCHTEFATKYLPMQNVHAVVREKMRRLPPATWDPASLAAGAWTSTTIAVTSASIGSPATAGLSTITVAGLVLTAAVTSPGTVTVTLVNNTAGVVDVSSGTLRVYVHEEV